ncbi:MAG: hypothetical protein H8E32_01455 [Nitrospinae bacterium]|nr:hypothetical protein [Nitrospinota bacterium]
MKEKRRLDTLEGGGFFQSSITFDEVEKVERKKRRQPNRRGPRRRNNKSPFKKEGETNCPGCGAEIENEEFLDALISFVIAAHDFHAGDPVRARFIQTLRNDVSNLSLPRPSESWELETVLRIENQVRILIDAELRRMKAKVVASAEEDLRLLIRQELEEEVYFEVKDSIKDEIESELSVKIRKEVEQSVRKEVENEMWAKFEEVWRQRNTDESE